MTERPPEQVSLSQSGIEEYHPDFSSHSDSQDSLQNVNDSNSTI